MKVKREHLRTVRRVLLPVMLAAAVCLGAESANSILAEASKTISAGTTQSALAGTAKSPASGTDKSTSSGTAIRTDTKEIVVPAFYGEPYYPVNDNVPFFNESELVTRAFENYTKLDSQGRCGVAYANICKEIMPTEKREAIGSVKPTGWQTAKYNDLIEGNYLYNRCHLIGFQLAGENANNKNLITGTRYMNVEGMLPFENMVDDYVEKGNNRHVLYRVTPVFTGKNLVADGVLMEAFSVEDKGKGICFNVFCYNVQPGIVVDYSNGKSDRGATEDKAKAISFSVRSPKTPLTPDKSFAKSLPSTGANSAGKSGSSSGSSAAKSSSSGTNVTGSGSGGSSAANSSSSAKAEPAKTEAQPAVQPATATAQEQLVWLSATGSKYHNKNNCGKMDPSKARQVPLSEAQKNYGPCSKCF